MKVWLDDVRPPPDKTWTWFKDVESLTQTIQIDKTKITEMSLDHDLGEEQVSGYIFVKWMASTNTWPKKKPVVHSMNPIGRENMEKTIDRYFPKGSTHE